MNIYHYQTIDEVGFVGRYDTPKEFDKIGLPQDLRGKTVLDIGCNEGAFLVECANRGARVYGVEPNIEWRIIARGVLEELGFDHYIVSSIKDFHKEAFHLVLLLSVTHVVEGMTGQQLLDKAWELVHDGGMLIVEINDRLQKESIKLPDGAVFYGYNKDNRSVYSVIKDHK